MTMATFTFNKHIPRHMYPQGDQQQFGKGYTFAVKPEEPEQRTFILKFEAMQWDAADATIDMQTMITFYETHKMWDRFIYPHPKYGNLTVRFAMALEVPESLKGGSGATNPFEIRLLEQPL